MTTNTPAFPTAGLTILDQAPISLRANPRNARTHSKKQIAKIADSIRAFGFTVPLVVDETGLVLAGHGRLLAAKQLGLPTVPTVRLDHLSETHKRAYAIADNKIATLAGWDRATLALELGELAIHLPEIGLDLSVTGFEIAELDLLTGDLEEERLASREDEPLKPNAPVSRLGDLWQLDPHRILCGSACDRDDVERLMAGREADMVFTDPPYNVPISGHVMGRGRVQHREFVMGSGEMARALAARSGQPEGWTWRLGSEKGSGLAATFRMPPSPYREPAHALGLGHCCICGQPVFRFGWHRDLWGTGTPNKNARWHSACVIAWKFWAAPSDQVKVLKAHQRHRCAASEKRLLKTAEVDHRTPLYRVWREHRDAPWATLLAYWGAPNLQVVNRVVHIEKCSTEAGERALQRRSFVSEVSLDTPWEADPLAAGS